MSKSIDSHQRVNVGMTFYRWNHIISNENILKDDTFNWYQSLSTKHYEGKETKEDVLEGTCNTHVSNEKCTQILIEKPKRQDITWDTRHRWEDNIKVDLKWTASG